MRLEITGRQFAITPAARKLVERGIGHTLKLLHDSVISAHVVLTRQRGRIHAEVTVHVSREHFLHGEGSGADLQVALTAATEKIQHQAEKLKGKWKARKRRDGLARAKVDGAGPATADDRGRRIIRTK